MPLAAKIVAYSEIANGRATGRRTLRLRVCALASGEDADALVLNLSTQGLLIESAVSLNIHDNFIVELPEMGAATAEVIWVRDNFAGCRFREPISAAVVSASILRARPEERVEAGDKVLAGLPSPDIQWPSVSGRGRSLRVVAIAGIVIAVTIACVLVLSLLGQPAFSG